MSYFLHSAPFVRITLPFALGVAVAFATAPTATVIFVGLILSILLTALLLVFWKEWANIKHNPWFGLGAACAFLLMGYSWTAYVIDLRSDRVILALPEGTFLAELLDFPEPKSNTYALKLEVSALLHSGAHEPTQPFTILGYISKTAYADTLLPGDMVVFAVKPQPHPLAPNPYQFDFGAYLTSQGIVGTVYLKDGVHAYRPVHRKFNLANVFANLRAKGIESFRDGGVHQRELGVVSALVLGKRDMVDADIRQAFAESGTVHILAVSGLHVGIIYLFIATVLGRVLPGKRLSMYRLLLSIAVLWLYAGVAGFSPSVLRAATMFSFIALGKEYSRFGNVYNMLALSAFLLLLLNPYLLVSVGFQLSYLAVLGIVVIYPMLYHRYTAPNAFVDKLWSLLVVSISAQLATFPLSVFYFHQFPVYFMFSNLLVIPLATALLYAGIAGIVLAWIPFVSNLIFHLVNGLAWILNEVVLLFNTLPYPVIKGLFMTAFEVMLLYLLFVLGYRAIGDPRRGRLAAALLLLLVISGSFAFRKIDQALRPTSVLFHAEGASILLVAQGRTAHLYEHHTKQEAEKHKDFALQGFLTANGIEQTLVFPMGRVTLPDKTRLMCVRNEEEMSEALQSGIKYVLVHHEQALSGINGPLNGDSPIFILDGSVPYYKRDKLIAQLKSVQATVLVTSDGAIHF